jgi:FAD-dependent urate hydroxylase
MRVLIVGAGIAGLSLAAMLCLHGIESLLIEKATPEGDAGYVIGLWPLGTRVLHGLNLYEEFGREAFPMRTYRLCNGEAEFIKEFARAHRRRVWLHRLAGATRSHSTPAKPRLHWINPVETLAQSRDEVYVTLTDGTSHSCDLVVGSDGIHSRVRDLIEGPSPHWNTNWGLWGWWVDSAVAPDRAAAEYWSGGRFLGIYPALHRASVFAGAPLARCRPGEATERSRRIHDLFAQLSRRIPQIFDSLPDEMRLYSIEMFAKNIARSMAQPA